jgi:hypothetical protein
LVFASPATAGNDALREEIRKLEDKVDALSGQQSTQLEQTIESYLDESSAWEAAEGEDGMKNITITAAFTANASGTLDVDTNDRFVVSGDVDLGFHFNVTENLSLHITATVAAGGGGSSTVNAGGSSPVPTFSGATDGIGTNGNVSTTGTGRALNVYEAYVAHTAGALNWEAGAMDPRVRFMQNNFADDENTQFINNLFDDSPSILWPTTSGGAGVLGVHAWIAFGGDNKDMVTISLGWFGPAGTAFINRSNLYFQVTLHFDVGKGRGMNVRLMLNYDDINRDSGGDATIAYGLSFDWEMAENFGLFLRVASNDDDATRGNPVELDFSLGVQVTMGDDGHVLGVALGFIQANGNVVGAADDEFTLEVYFRFSLEEGKLQITPFVMYIDSPAGSTGVNDSLVIVGIRFHVPL